MLPEFSLSPCWRCLQHRKALSWLLSAAEQPSRGSEATAPGSPYHWVKNRETQGFTAATTAGRSDHLSAWTVDWGLGWLRVWVVKWIWGLFTRYLMNFSCPSPLERKKEKAFLRFFCLFLGGFQFASLSCTQSGVCRNSSCCHSSSPEVLGQSIFPTAFGVHLLLVGEQFPGCLIIYSGNDWGRMSLLHLVLEPEAPHTYF